MNPLSKSSSGSKETIISAVILVLLAIVAAWVLAQRSTGDISRFGIRGTDPNTPANAATDQQTSGVPIKPSAYAPPGYTGFAPAKTYESDNLYQKINGKAPMYIEAGFVKLYSQQLVNTGDDSLITEINIYDMGSARNAFSIYSRQRRSDAASIEGLDIGYKTSNALYSVHGKYYIELVGFAESQQLYTANKQIIENIRQSLATTGQTGITETDYFPKKQLIAGSEKLYLSSAFGFAEMDEVVAARYDIGEYGVTAFLSERTDAEEAKKLADSYAKFLRDNGANQDSVDSERLKAKNITVLDFYGTYEIIFHEGRFTGGVHEADNKGNAEDITQRLIRKISEIGE